MPILKKKINGLQDDNERYKATIKTLKAKMNPADAEKFKDSIMMMPEEANQLKDKLLLAET